MIGQYSGPRIHLERRDGHMLDLLPAYVLNSLNKYEAAMVERHVKKCSECREALTQYQETFDCMIQAVPLVAPAKSLRDKVIEKVQDTSRRRFSKEASLFKWNNIWRNFRNFVSSPIRLAVVISAAVLIVVLALNNIFLYQRVDELKVFMPGSDIHVIRLIGTADAPRAIGYVMVFSDGKAGTLAVREAPVLESGFQYQVWLTQQGQGVSGGMFNVNENGFGTLEINSSLPLENFDTLDITKEPQGGSETPTGGKILAGDL